MLERCVRIGQGSGTEHKTIPTQNTWVVEDMKLKARTTIAYFCGGFSRREFPTIKNDIRSSRAGQGKDVNRPFVTPDTYLAFVRSKCHPKYFGFICSPSEFANCFSGEGIPDTDKGPARRSRGK